MLRKYFSLIFITSLSTTALLVTQSHKWSTCCTWPNSSDIGSHQHNLKSRTRNQIINQCILSKIFWHCCQLMYSSRWGRPIYRNSDFFSSSSPFFQYSRTLFKSRDKKLRQMKSLLVVLTFLWNLRTFKWLNTYPVILLLHFFLIFLCVVLYNQNILFISPTKRLIQLDFILWNLKYYKIMWKYFLRFIATEENEHNYPFLFQKEYTINENKYEALYQILAEAKSVRFKSIWTICLFISFTTNLKIWIA